MPYEADLRRAADVLNAGKKVAMLVGAGTLRATDEVIAVADKLGAGVAKALLGKAALPDDLPWVTGSIGLLGTKPSWDMMQECDTLLMVGSGFPYSEFLPKNGAARGVQIDIKADMLSLRYPMEVNLVGDSAETLRALLPLLQQKTDHGWRKRIEKNVAEWWKDLEERAMHSANPVNPQRVTWELSPRLPDRCIITSDSGSCANWYARDLKIRRGMMCSLSGGLASMGAAVPYAIAAKFAHPDRPVIALVGDGAMQMNNMAELITVMKYWREWSNPQWIVCVWNNQDLNQVTWEQRVQEGNPKYEVSQQIPDVPYHKFGELIGMKGIFVDNPDRVGPAWDEALAADRPVVLEIKTDPNVPPLPPHITLQQARNFTSTLLKGDPEEGSVLVDTAKEVLSTILPGHRHDSHAARRGRSRASAYRIPTDKPEADGTAQWDTTTLVVVEVAAGATDRARLHLHRQPARAADRGQAGRIVRGSARRSMLPALWQALQRGVRNLGREGLAATAISAVDAALWDLKAKLLDQPLALLLGRCRDAAADLRQRRLHQLHGRRIRARQLCGLGRARRLPLGENEGRHRSPIAIRIAWPWPAAAIGDHGLFVDANGAYSTQAGAGAGRHLLPRRRRDLVRGAGFIGRSWMACG